MANRRPEIRNILIILSAGVIAALSMTAFFVWNFGPSGRYNLEAVLIEPSVLTHLNYNDANPHIGHSDRYIFDKIVWRDSRGNHPVESKAFKKLYALLKPDVSVSEMDSLFSKGMSPRLTIWVKTESPSTWQKDAKIFQEIEFEKDFYRISLHEASSRIAWVYFRHPDILQAAEKLLGE